MLSDRRFWLGAIVSAIFLVLFFWKIDLARISIAAREANYWWLPPGVVCYFIAVYFRTLRWHFLMLALKPVPTARLYPIVVIGYMANNVLPMRLGELARAYVAGRREGVAKASVLATILIERVFDGIFLLMLAAVVWPFLPVADLLQQLSPSIGVSNAVFVALVSAPFLLVLTAFFSVVFFPAFGRVMVLRGASFLPRGIGIPLQKLAFAFLNGLQVLSSPGRVAATAFLTAPIWFMEGMLYLVISFGFKLAVPYHGLLLTMSTSNLITSIPSSGGGVGPFEYATRVTMQSMAVPAEVAAAYAIVLHVALLVPVTLLGLLLLWTGNISLSEAARQGADGQDHTNPLLS